MNRPGWRLVPKAFRVPVSPALPAGWEAGRRPGPSAGVCRDGEDVAVGFGSGFLPRNPLSSTLGLGERRGMSRLAQHLVHVPSMQFFQVDHLASVFFQRDGAMLHQCQ